MVNLERALRSADELVLETRGRRTGRPHRVTLWFAYEGSDIWLRTDPDADWFRNLARDPRCRIVVGGDAADARREPIDDEAQALPVRRQGVRTRRRPGPAAPDRSLNA